MTINTETIRDAAEVLDVLTSNLPPDHPFRAEAEGRAKERVSQLYAVADQIDAQTAQLAAYPADWREDSSLETWFPLTAEQLKAQTAEIDRLRNMAWSNGDVLKESQAEAVKLRAELAHLRAVLSQALMALEGYLPSHRNDVTDRAIAVARAALSGESNG